MRLSHVVLTAVLAALVLAPAASARINPSPPGPSSVQDLRSPDARDADAAGNAQRLQDLARLHSENSVQTSKDNGALAQERYYSSYGTAKHPARGASTDDGSPWLTIGLGFGLTFVVAGAVAMAVRTRRRVHVAV
jgi:hypothetical protein